MFLVRVFGQVEICRNSFVRKPLEAGVFFCKMSIQIHPERMGMGNVYKISATIYGFNIMNGHCVLCPEELERQVFELETEINRRMYTQTRRTNKKSGR